MNIFLLNNITAMIRSRVRYSSAWQSDSNSVLPKMVVKSQLVYIQSIFISKPERTKSAKAFIPRALNGMNGFS